MRGAAPGPVPVSLARGVPESFLGNDFTVGLVEAFDDVLAPVVGVLADLDAYLDPRYAPDDFVRWVASWLSPQVGARLSADEARARLVDLRTALLARGTLHGVAAAVRACTGREPAVRDNGGVGWSARPHAALPGSRVPLLEVDVVVADDEPDPDALLDLVRAVVDDVRPVHVPALVRRASGRRPA